MEPYHKKSLNPMQRHSKSLLQDLFHKGFQAEGKDMDIHSQSGRRQRTHMPVCLHPLALDSIMTGRGNLLLLNGPNTAEIYKPNKPSLLADRGRLSDVYLPAITGRRLGLQAVKGTLSQSCPYLCNRRRDSTSSVISQRTADNNNKQGHLRAQRNSKRSNVTVTMTYLGQGFTGTSQDEMKVLQQICGGENICVFKGGVQPGEEFQFISQRHHGYPFSATFFVNGIMAARISSCCEYRYAPGFQQGRKSCFRLTRLTGGKPCYRCVSARHGIGHRPKDGMTENYAVEKTLNEGTMDSCPSSPLFIPVGTERSLRRTRTHPKDGSAVSTDSEDINSNSKEKRRHKRHKGKRNRRLDSKGSECSQTHEEANEEEAKPSASKQHQAHLKKSKSVKSKGKENPVSDNKTKVPDLLQDEEALSKQNGKEKMDPESNRKTRNGERLRDFYEECVEMSTGLETGPDKQKWFKANKQERHQIREQLSSCPQANGSASEVELSEESDSGLRQSKTRLLKKNRMQLDAGGQEAPDEIIQTGHGEAPDTEQDLQTKLDAMMDVLNTSDEVDQLVLRNTGLTDDLLNELAAALKSSLSEVTMINLNLNHIGPPGVHTLLDLLKSKPQIKGLLLFGNQLGDTGVQTLLSGLAELQITVSLLQTQVMQGHTIPRHPGASHLSVSGGFELLELDLGGNGVGSDGLRVLATYMRHHSQLQYLGLAQTNCTDMAAWTDLFESVRVNTKITHIILDESNLGDQGVRLFAEVLKDNGSLSKVDLDGNGVGEPGGNSIFEALLHRRQGCIEHLSLEGNYISTALMTKIHQEVKPNRPGHL